MSTLYGYKGQYWKVIHNFQYTGESVPFTLDPGKYLLICHGAQGGLGAISSINYGGVAMGVIDLKSSKTMYAVVGGNGASYIDNSTPGSGGFNGGGNGGKSYSTSYATGAGGGGASDIRLLPPDSPTSQMTIEKTLPDEYQEVEYLQSTGTQYIDTWLIPTTNMKAEVKYASNATGQSSGVFGSYFSGSPTSRFQIFQNNKYIGLGIGTGYVDVADDTDIHISVLDAKNVAVYHDGVEQAATTGTYSNDLPGKTITLFARHTDETSFNYGKCKIYYAKIWKDDTVIRYYIPCYRKSDSVYGMYDIVTDTFLTNNGSGTFTGGDDITETTTFQYEITINSLYSRIIVAGGGGGGTNINPSNSYPNYTGNGGGIVGGYPSMNSAGVNYYSYASQSSGYEFGNGMDAPSKTGSNTCGREGASGGGGGWYGGYACGSTNRTYSSSNGGGGSGYVLTESSYKPDGYSVGEEYYMTDIFLDGGGAIDPCIMVCVPVKTMDIGDVVIFPCIGETEHIKLPVGEYIFECYGGDGGCRYDSNVCARGGYVKGTITNPNYVDMYVNVGGSGLGTGLLDSGSWSMMNRPTLMFNGGGAPGTMGNIKSCAGGGGTDIRIGDDSLYSRIIVAGGAGGIGKAASTAGAGGGVSGGTNSGASYGESPGPGTQTESPQSTAYPIISGGFGYGGSGVTYSASSSMGFGGAGGGGWFGGSGTYPDSGDDDRAGNGGSGYVLNEDSYKPEGYLVGKDYYVSDAVLTTGGNTLPVGHTMVRMTILDISLTKMVAHDAEGFKRYDSETKTWVYLSSVITTDDIETYGVYAVNSDEGLLNDYQIYILDNDDTIGTLEVSVVPPKQTITTIADTPMKVSKLALDAKYDSETFDIDVSSWRKGVGEDAQLVLNVNVDKKNDSETDLRIYCVYAQTSGNASSSRYIAPKTPSQPEEDPDRKKYLLKVGTGTGIPTHYKQYLTTLDGNAVTSIQSVVACEHDRVLYIAIVLNSTTLRLQKINLLTNKSTIIRDIPRSSLDNYYYGGLLADDDYLYFTSSNNESQHILYRIDLNDPLGEISKFTPGSSSDYNFSSFGKMEWYDDRTIIIEYKKGFMLFDTKKTSFTLKAYSNKGTNRWDMSVGKKFALSHYNGTGTTTIYTCEIESNTWSTITLPGSGQACSCYDGNGKFYIAQTSNLIVWDEETQSIEQTIAIPWTNPNSVNYSKGVIYSIMKGSNKLWMYNTKTKIFNMILLPWTISAMAGSTIMRPTVFDGYIFIPYFKLGIISYVDPPKYNLGGKYDQYKFLFNKEHESEYTFDDRFVTFRDASMTVHDGVISKPMIDMIDSDGIKYASMNKSEYNKFKRISFGTKSTTDGEEETT